ncbi:MAG: hypothetical protein J0M02_01380 [Planctomycetes bacterium]|nr:hypothetical protein [Planctomycetota bacterium]
MAGARKPSTAEETAANRHNGSAQVKATLGPAKSLEPYQAAAKAPNFSFFIWSVANLLRGDYKQSDFSKVILPFTSLRCFICALKSTKQLEGTNDSDY